MWSKMNHRSTYQIYFIHLFFTLLHHFAHSSTKKIEKYYEQYYELFYNHWVRHFSLPFFIIISCPELQRHNKSTNRSFIRFYYFFCVNLLPVTPLNDLSLDVFPTITLLGVTVFFVSLLQATLGTSST